MSGGATRKNKQPIVIWDDSRLVGEVEGLQRKSYMYLMPGLRSLRRLSAK